MANALRYLRQSHLIAMTLLQILIFFGIVLVFLSLNGTFTLRTNPKPSSEENFFMFKSFCIPMVMTIILSSIRTGIFVAYKKAQIIQVTTIYLSQCMIVFAIHVMISSNTEYKTPYAPIAIGMLMAMIRASIEFLDNLIYRYRQRQDNGQEIIMQHHEGLPNGHAIIIR
ncbi:hypothetical protein ACOME3_005314 [Neoechinorhynchus agilis]